ncbi:hypothetical protein GCM10010885_23170 [Alicyclobacillus cellulosilyticus]|uniref:SsuA/THI5-like domain-containing protein n=1 Tax=Alicyclobacillus cellulosilyticus TaxID=1003997 RepID=A0A917KI26_9BACL|nr:ABC transporter substrate-binding protein [Alicyclobacillus cellulosilyticus]GGJ13239.1 hypothetical protein GCM10010885_23170 [Alicyclobacillus cellulosilyticus]
MRKSVSWHFGLAMSLTLALNAIGYVAYPKDATSVLANVTLVTSWYANPEFGGEYEALRTGMFKKAGLEVRIRQGGPTVSTVTMVASGRAQFGIDTADNLLEARGNGIPLVAVAAIFQTSPLALMYHSSHPLKSFSDLNGRTVIVSPAQAYWLYIEKKYNIHAHVLNETAPLSAVFLNDPTAVQVCFATNEPYYAKKKGYDVGYKLVADAGFNPYPDVIYTTESFLRSHPDVVKKFVHVSLQAWSKYLASPVKTNQYMQKLNPNMDMGGAMYELMTEKPLAFGGDAKTHGIGYMSKSRWAILYRQMMGVGAIKHPFNVNDAFTTRFIE